MHVLVPKQRIYELNKIPAIRHHQATEKRSYQYNKLYSTIDLHYANTLCFELLRAFLDIPPLSIVGPSGTQSTSSSLPPNTIFTSGLPWLGLPSVWPIRNTAFKFIYLFLYYFIYIRTIA